jgi:hypothetical protein
MFDLLAVTATSFPTPTPGQAVPSPLPDDLQSWPADHRLAALLDTVDPMHLSDIDRVRYMQCSQRVVAHYQAQALIGISAVADSYVQLELDDPEHAYDGTTFELRAALTWTRRHAESELDFASDLLVRLPSVLRALSDGRIDRAKAKIIVDTTAHLSIVHARHVADTVLEEASRLTTGQLRVRIRRASIDTDPDSVRMQQAKAVDARAFRSWTEPDGTISLEVTGIDPVRGQELADRINRIARGLRRDGESRSMDQLRADIAVDLLCGTNHPTVGSVHLNISLDRLFDPNTRAAADLAGYGPILDDILEQTTNSGSWEWTVDHHRTPIADGHTRRRPTTSQQRKVRHRYPTCIAPGCRTPAVDCDLDHTTPWAESATTDSSQMAPFCRHDHTTRHHTGWTYTHQPDGRIIWKSPLGTTYTTDTHDP